MIIHLIYNFQFGGAKLHIISLYITISRLFLLKTYLFHVFYGSFLHFYYFCTLIEEITTV